MRRCGLVGGTFDPVHKGHLALARQARDQLRLHEVRWIPAGSPWQKTTSITAAPHRWAMLNLAVEGEAGFTCDDMELRREGPSYTIDTVESLRATRADEDYVLIIGQDQFARLHTWHRWKELLALVTLAVASRDGITPKPHAELAAISHRCVPLHLPPVPVSSTEVRARAARGADISDMVPASVARYIASHSLYTSA